ncbi:phosphatidylethanolamine-binding protein [Xylogone sp. PMI_703]|nr:phosphatidylethanolamine-binding protein [Xylogone sp. PMI_703]
MHPIVSRRSILLTILAIAYAFGIASAQTPPGLEPSTKRHLNVTFKTTVVNPAGITVPQNVSLVVIKAPELSFGQANGTYAVFMIDFSLETNITGTNTTLLHWAQTGLSAPEGTTSLTSQQANIAPYINPEPPAGQTHTYGVVLFREPANFTIPIDYVALIHNLTTTDPVSSVPYRIGFNLTRFVNEAGLGQPVAADFFLVATPGPTATTNSTLSTNTSAPTTNATGGIIPTMSTGPTISVASILEVPWMWMTVGMLYLGLC